MQQPPDWTHRTPNGELAVWTPKDNVMRVRMVGAFDGSHGRALVALIEGRDARVQAAAAAALRSSMRVGA